jgi:hypothetical protein
LSTTSPGISLSVHDPERLHFWIEKTPQGQGSGYPLAIEIRCIDVRPLPGQEPHCYEGSGIIVARADKGAPRIKNLRRLAGDLISAYLPYLVAEDPLMPTPYPFVLTPGQHDFNHDHSMFSRNKKTLLEEGDGWFSNNYGCY